MKWLARIGWWFRPTMTCQHCGQVRPRPQWWTREPYHLPMPVRWEREGFCFPPDWCDRCREGLIEHYWEQVVNNCVDGSQEKPK